MTSHRQLIEYFEGLAIASADVEHHPAQDLYGFMEYHDDTLNKILDKAEGPVILWEHHKGRISDNLQGTVEETPYFALHFICHKSYLDGNNVHLDIHEFTKSMAQQFLARIIHDSDNGDGCWYINVQQVEYERIRFPHKNNGYGFTLMFPLTYTINLQVDNSKWNDLS
jgi:hypothetical protein